MAAIPTVCMVLAPSRLDKVGVLRAMTQAYAGGFIKHGRRPVFVDPDDADFPARLAQAARRPDVELLHSVGSRGIETPLDGSQTLGHLLARSGKTFIGHHGDFPFSPWVARRLKVDFPRRFTFYNDPHSPDFTRRMIEPRGVHAYAAQSYCDIGLDPARVTPPSQRPIPLLYSGKHLKTAQAHELLRDPRRVALYNEICERGLHEYRRSFLDVSAEAYAAHEMALDAPSASTQWLLYTAYETILSRRREGLLERLARHPAHLAVTGDGDMPPQHPQSVLHRALAFRRLLKMMDQARAMLIVQPNFSHGITERALSAMHRRTVVLATPSAFFDENFVDGEDYLRLDGTWADLDEKIALLADARRVDAIAESAWRKVVGRFSPEATVARYLEVIRSARP